MGLEQMYALTGGGRFRRPYVNEINARKQYLPNIYAQRKEDVYRDKTYALQQQALEQGSNIARKNLAMQQKALDEQKKAQKRANILGYANIGLGAGLGIAGLGSDLGWWGKDETPVANDIVSGIGGIGTSPLGEVARSVAQNNVPGTSGITDYLGDIGNAVWDPIKKTGEAAWDFGTGIYDSIVGNTIDTDWGDVGDYVGGML